MGESTIIFTTLVLLAIASVTSLPTQNNKRHEFCDIEAKDHKGQYTCCSSHHKYRLNAGVCEIKSYKTQLPIFGYSEKATKKVVSREDAHSDHDANEKNPGDDEGVCHVYKIKVGRNGGKCVPGNVVMAAKNVHDWLAENYKDASCSVDLGPDCAGEPKSSERYMFAVKLNGLDGNQTTLDDSLSSELRNKYRCNIEVHGNEYFVVCPL